MQYHFASIFVAIFLSKRGKKHGVNIATYMPGVNNVPMARHVSILGIQSKVGWAGNLPIFFLPKVVQKLQMFSSLFIVSESEELKHHMCPV